MRLKKPEDRVTVREAILNTIIREFSSQVNPKEVLRRLEGDSAAHYASIVAKMMLDNPNALMEIAAIVNRDVPILRREPQRVRGKPKKRDLVAWRDFILCALDTKLRFGADSHVRAIVTALNWREHGEAVASLVPQVEEYRAMRERFHAPYRDPDPYIIGCHGGRCGGMGGISRQIVSAVIKREDR